MTQATLFLLYYRSHPVVWDSLTSKSLLSRVSSASSSSSSPVFFLPTICVVVRVSVSFCLQSTPRPGEEPKYELRGQCFVLHNFDACIVKRNPVVSCRDARLVCSLSFERTETRMK